MSKRENKMRGGLDALLGGGGSTPTDERSAAEAYEEELLLMEREQATPQEEEELINSVEDEALREALRQRQMRKRGRPRKDAALRTKESEIFTRTTWIIRRDLLAKLKEISFRETLTLKEIMEQLISEAVASYESKHGELKPTDHRGDASKLFK